MGYDHRYGGVQAKPIFAAVMLSICITAASLWIPLTMQTLGQQVESYFDDKSQIMEFCWVYNCTLINVNLTEYYRHQQETAYVDGVRILLTQSTVQINVFFAPYQAQIVGEGTLTEAEWVDLSDSLIHSGLGRMNRASDSPDNIPPVWPIELIIDVFFDDNTLFSMGYSELLQLVYIQHGTWSGEYTESGWPIIDTFATGVDWLEEAGHLRNAMTQIQSAVISAVPSYPQ